MVINEGMHSCWQITPFSSEWKLRTFVDLSVQAVRGHKEERGRRTGAGGGGENKVPKKMIWSKKKKINAKAYTAADCNGFFASRC